MTHIEILEFNKAKGRYCYRAKMLVNGRLGGLIWLSRRDIDAIKKDKSYTLSNFEKYESKKNKGQHLNAKCANCKWCDFVRDTMIHCNYFEELFPKEIGKCDKWESKTK